MANHFGARVAISRFQRLKTHRRSHPGRCPGLLHFTPLALGIQVLTQILNRWVRSGDGISPRSGRLKVPDSIPALTCWAILISSARRTKPLPPLGKAD